MRSWGSRSAPRMCEFFIAEYSMSLLTLDSMWQVAMDYLGHCLTYGQHYMQQLLARVPLNTDKKANKIIHLCQRYNFKDQSESERERERERERVMFWLLYAVRSVCKVMAMRAFKRGRLGAALTWCIRGKVRQPPTEEDCFYLVFVLPRTLSLPPSWWKSELLLSVGLASNVSPLVCQVHGEF